MIGAVDIANAALLKLGDKTITSLDDDSRAARLAKLRYPSARQAVLRMHSWKFAKTRLVLAPSSTPPAFGWSYYLPFPENFIRLVSVEDDEPFEIEGAGILSDSSAVSIRYIWDIEDVMKFDVLFCEALATKLALELCQPLLQTETPKGDLYKEFDMVIRKARNVDSAEGDLQTIEADGWLISRRAGSKNLS